MPRPQNSPRAVALKPSRLAIGAQARRCSEPGETSAFSAGEPVSTRLTSLLRPRQALRDGITRYGPAAGDPELREAVAEKLSSSNGIATSPEQVLITNGGKQAIYNLFQVLLNPGDEVLLPAPYWLSYPEMAALAGAKVKLIPTQAEEGFRLDLRAVEAAISPRSRLLVLNSPGNPTGRVMERQELEGVAELVRRHPQLLVMSDEIYEFLLAEGEQHRNCGDRPGSRRSLFHRQWLRQSWAMTGWRLGYLAGHQDVIRLPLRCRGKHQQCLQLCSTRALAAIRTHVIAFQRWRRASTAAGNCSRRSCKRLKASPSLNQGVLYAFPQLPESAGGSMDRRLEQAGLAVVPGLALETTAAFDCPALCHVRRSGMVCHG